MSLAIIKWLAVISLLILPFSFFDGVADWRYLTVAPVAGLLWIAALIYCWRQESLFAGVIAFWAVIGAYHLSDSLYASEPPFGHFLQWITALILFAGLPVIAFRSRLIRYCGLENENGTTSRSSTTA